MKGTAEQKLEAGGHAAWQTGYCSDSTLTSSDCGVGACLSLSPCFLDLLVQQPPLLTQTSLYCCQRAACCGPRCSTSVLAEGLQKQRNRDEVASFPLKHKHTYLHTVNVKVQKELDQEKGRSLLNRSSSFAIYDPENKAIKRFFLEAKTYTSQLKARPFGSTLAEANIPSEEFPKASESSSGRTPVGSSSSSCGDSCIPEYWLSAPSNT